MLTAFKSSNTLCCSGTNVNYVVALVCHRLSIAIDRRIDWLIRWSDPIRRSGLIRSIGSDLIELIRWIWNWSIWSNDPIRSDRSDLTSWSDWLIDPGIDLTIEIWTVKPPHRKEINMLLHYRNIRLGSHVAFRHQVQTRWFKHFFSRIEVFKSTSKVLPRLLTPNTQRSDRRKARSSSASSCTSTKTSKFAQKPF